MRHSECEAFLEYPSGLSDQGVQRVQRNYEWLNEQPIRKHDPWEQFTWMAEQARTELERRRSGNG